MNGLSLIAGQTGAPGNKTFNAQNPASGEILDPPFYEASLDELNRACDAAWNAFESYSQLPAATRAAFLRTIAEEIESCDEIITRGNQETGLPEARLKGERARTCGQLRLFATVVEEGSWLSARIDHGEPERTPQPKPDLRSMQCPLGPVAVFCASNFPLAYSVAGGDTASALAVGCPVVVKAHHAHPGTAEIVAEAVMAAIKKCEMPSGVFSLIFGPGRTLGQALVKHPRIKAVGFTGSRAGGRALMDIAAARDEPIPVYAEMSSVNPVVILPGALQERGEALATGTHGSVTLGVGQFCTNPGLIFLPAGDVAQPFVDRLASLMADTAPCTMLHSGIRQAYVAGLQSRQNVAQVEEIVSSDVNSGAGDCDSGTVLFQTTAEVYLRSERLADEVFGPSTLLVRYENHDQLRALVESLEGQLTATVHASDEELQEACRMVATLQQKAGRLIFNGFPTGVEVCHAIVHGGPYPATSDGRTTSVGSLAVHRFARQVAWQDCPAGLLPEALQEDNPLGIRRLVDGEWK